MRRFASWWGGLRLNDVSLIVGRKLCACDRKGNGSLGVIQKIQRSMVVTCNEAAVNSLNKYNYSVASTRRSYTLYVGFWANVQEMDATLAATEQLDIDEIDRKILNELLRDCRRSYRSVSRRAGVSVGTVLTRVRRLEKAGIIKGYSAILDHEKLGYQLTALAEITVSKGKLLEMEQAISKLPNTCAVYDVTGLTDAIVLAKFRSREELSRFTKNLLSMPFIDRSNTHVVLTTVKEDLRLL